MSDVDTGSDAGADIDAGSADTGAEASTTFDVADYATQLGWKPKEDWKGDDSKWTDAAEFVRHTVQRTREIAENTKKRMEDNSRINARLIAEERKRSAQAIRDAEARIAEAAEAGDPDAAREATRELRSETQRQEVVRAQQDFTKSNPWFGVDKKATRLATLAAQEALDDTDGKATFEEQFKAAEEAVREAMPHLFEGDDDEAPKPGKKAPLLQQGSRTPPIKRGPKGWADIPDADRRVAKKAYVDKGILTEAEFAKSYWTEKGEAA